MKRYNQNNDSYKKLLNSPYYLVAFMSAIIIIVTSISIYRLYLTGLQQQEERLQEVVESQSAVINSMINHELIERKTTLQRIEKEVLDNLLYSHKQFSGFGKSGEYTLAKLDHGKIHFMLRHRHHEVDRMNSVPIDDSKIAEPMRKALKGESGVFIGLDYRGEKVVAAYTPIKTLKWGIVAKIDLKEIQEPYINESIKWIALALVLIIFGGGLIIKLTKPLAEEIQRGRNYNRKLFNESPIGLALTNMRGNMMDMNSSFLKMTGYSRDELLKLSYWDITPKEYFEKEQEQLESLIEYGVYGPYEKEYIHKDGHLFYVRLLGSLLKINKENFIWSSIEDITEKKKYELALKEASLVFENTHEGILITDADVKVCRVNSRFTQITGYTLEEIEGKNPSFLNSGVHDKEFYTQMWKQIKEEGSWFGEINDRRKNGEYFTSLQSVSAVKNEKQEVISYISVFADISERKTYEKRLSYLASHDNLTSLPNRMHFNDNLIKAIQVAKRHKAKLAVLFLDLNHFKKVNDTFGHEVGDKLLIEVAKRFKDSIREEDTVARLGGDEFAIILNDVKSKDDVITVCKKVLENIKEPMQIEYHTIVPSTSIGISVYPDNADNAESLLNLADNAMYMAKKKEISGYEFYSSSIF